MIYLIVGPNGSGKTLYALDFLRTEPEFNKPGRRRYINHVHNVDHAYFGAEPLEDAKLWYECPVGSVILIDEAHEVFPPLKPFAEKPKHYSEIAEHRRQGIDLILVTQDPMDIDRFIRGKRLWRFVYVHRWDGSDYAVVTTWKEFQEKPLSKVTARRRLSKVDWKFPTDLYEKYKSAEMHTPTVTRSRWHRAIPFLAGLLVVLLGVVGWKMYTALFSNLGGDSEVVAASPVGVPSPRAREAEGGLFTREDEPADYLASLQPRIEGVPWSAPIYDNLTRPRDVPRAYCYRLEDLNECRCFTQQMTVLNLAQEICNWYVDEGLFDPTLGPEPGEGIQGAAPKPLSTVFKPSSG